MNRATAARLLSIGITHPRVLTLFELRQFLVHAARYLSSSRFNATPDNQRTHTLGWSTPGPYLATTPAAA